MARYILRYALKASVTYKPYTKPRYKNLNFSFTSQSLKLRDCTSLLLCYSDHNAACVRAL